MRTRFHSLYSNRCQDIATESPFHCIGVLDIDGVLNTESTE